MMGLKQWLAARKLERTTRERIAAEKTASQPHRKAWQTRRERESAARLERFVNDPIIRLAMVEHPRGKQTARARLRKALFLRDGPGCHYCGIELQIERYDEPNFATIEHVVPNFLGGPLSPENGVLACKKCNQDRGQIMGKVKIRIAHVMARAG